MLMSDLILTPKRIFQVIESCSGLRSIETLTMSAVLYSELFYRQPVPSEYFTNSTFGDAAISNADNSSQDAPIPVSEAVLAATEASAEDSPSAQAVEYKLASIPLAEQRRVISTQLHYFDHPLFGFIVQIRRYHRPADEETSDL